MNALTGEARCYQADATHTEKTKDTREVWNFEIDVQHMSHSIASFVGLLERVRAYFARMSLNCQVEQEKLRAKYNMQACFDGSSGARARLQFGSCR